MEKSSTLAPVTAKAVADELAWCLGRFLDATADEPVMQRAKECLVLWQALREGEQADLSLTSLHP